MQLEGVAMIYSKMIQLDRAIDEFADRIKPGSILSGQEYANESLRVLRAIQSTLSGLAKDVEKLSDGAGSGPASIER
jgi:hypothetical protein